MYFIHKHLTISTFIIHVIIVLQSLSQIKTLYMYLIQIINQKYVINFPKR